MRAAAKLGPKLDDAAEHARHAFHDRQTKAETAGDARALLEAVEFHEYVAAFRVPGCRTPVS